MEFHAENHSMYPRVGESDEDLRLRRAHHRFDQGEIDESELSRIEDDYVEEIIREQQEAGLDVVTDGMIRWYDHISHLAEKLRVRKLLGLYVILIPIIWYGKPGLPIILNGVLPSRSVDLSLPIPSASAP